MALKDKKSKFDRHYLGVDLQSKFNPYNFTFDTELTIVVRIN